MKKKKKKKEGGRISRIKLEAITSSTVQHRLIMGSKVIKKIAKRKKNR